MAQIQHYDKRVGITYVYESESYYDPEKKQSRSKRKLIGKLDPDTGEIVATGRRGRPSKNTTSDHTENDYRQLYLDTRKELAKAEAKIFSLQSEIDERDRLITRYENRLNEISLLCGKPL